MGEERSNFVDYLERNLGKEKSLLKGNFLLFIGYWFIIISVK